MTVTQTTFRGALLDGAADRPLGLTDAQGRAAGRRFDVYRNNVAVSLSEALSTGFPTIAKLLGAENFAAVAGVYLRQSPPMSPVMMHYGASFPAFLRSFEPLAHLGYLGDVADLELAMRRAYHAADVDPISANSLASVPPDQLGDVTLGLSPATQMQQSQWPVHAIWAFNMADGPKPPAIAQDIVVLRAEFDPQPHALSDGAYVCLQALMSGETLGAAAEAGTTDAPDFDLGALLGLLLGANAITSLTHPHQRSRI